MKTWPTVLHFLLALIVSVIAIELLLPTGDASPYEAGVMKGKEISRLLTFLLPGVLAVSAGWQLKKPWLLALGFAFIVCLFGLILWLLHLLRLERVVSDDEKKPLVRVEARLCQAAAGFSIRDPGEGFVPYRDAEVREQAEPDGADTKAWVFADPETGEVLVLRLFKNHPASEQDLERVSRELGEHLAQQLGGTLAQRSVARSGNGWALELTVEHPTEAPLLMRCVGFEGFLSSRLVCAQALAATVGRIPDLLSSLSWRRCEAASAG